MYEELDFAAGGMADFPDARQLHFALQNQARKTQSFVKQCFVSTADSALCRSMERNPDAPSIAVRTAVRHLQNREVLHYDGIHACIFCPAHQGISLLKLIIIYNGVQRHEDSGAEPMCIGAELFQIFHAVSGSLSGTESRPCNINGIGTAVDGRDADFYVFRRSK